MKLIGKNSQKLAQFALKNHHSANPSFSLQIFPSKFQKWQKGNETGKNGIFQKNENEENSSQGIGKFVLKINH